MKKKTIFHFHHITFFETVTIVVTVTTILKMTLHALQLIPYNNSLVKLKLNLTTKQFLKEQENNLTDHAHKRTTGTPLLGCICNTQKLNSYIYLLCLF